MAAFGHVCDQRHDMRGLVFLVMQQRDEFAHPDGFAILSHIAVFDLEGRQLLVPQAANSSEIVGAVVRMDQV
jgi:hypothetical protein